MPFLEEFENIKLNDDDDDTICRWLSLLLLFNWRVAKCNQMRYRFSFFIHFTVFDGGAIIA